MGHLKEEKRSWIFPTLATMGLLALLTHKSEFPTVFNRYSIHYTILMTLAAINLGLLWRKALLRVSYQRLIGRLSVGPLLSFLLVLIPVMFLIDFAGINPPRTRGDWVILMLVGVLFLQVEASSGQPVLMSSHTILAAWSIALTVILLEAIFALSLLESRTPKTHQEFIRLMFSKGKGKHDTAWREAFSIEKPSGTFRILGLSDSFGTAGGNGSNYHYLVEDMIRQNVLPSVQMINVSVVGYHPLHELAILRLAMPYSPDLVLHGFFVGNDFWVEGEDVYQFRNIITTWHPESFRYRPRNLLIRQWIGNAVVFLREQQRRREDQGLVGGENVGTLSKSEFLKTQMDRLNEWGKRTDKDVARMKKVFPVLDAIRSTAEAGGSRYVMIIHPDETQVNEALRREIIATFQLNEDEYDFYLPQEVLRSYCTDRGIPCLDLLPIFRAKARDGDVYLLGDTHYSRSGNELAAASISQFLRDRQFLPMDPEASAIRTQGRE